MVNENTATLALRGFFANNAPQATLPEESTGSIVNAFLAQTINYFADSATDDNANNSNSNDSNSDMVGVIVTLSIVVGLAYCCLARCFRNAARNTEQGNLTRFGTQI